MGNAIGGKRKMKQAKVLYATALPAKNTRDRPTISIKINQPKSLRRVGQGGLG
jgi:hypothetical protein